MTPETLRFARPWLCRAMVMATVGMAGPLSALEVDLAATPLINPANQALLRIPGFDVKELLQPVGMVLLEGDVMEGLSMQTFYQ